MSQIEHKNIPPGHQHGLVNWEYQTELERTSAGSFNVDDRHKLAFVVASGEYYLLKSVSPILWKLL